jgi:hypothetical protein
VGVRPFSAPRKLLPPLVPRGAGTGTLGGLRVFQLPRSASPTCASSSGFWLEWKGRSVSTAKDEYSLSGSSCSLISSGVRSPVLESEFDHGALVSLLAKKG